MARTKVFFWVALSLSALLGAGRSAAPGASSPSFTPSAAYLAYFPDGRVAVPQNYREWAYVSSGIDMTYSKGGMMMNQHMFDNVFVNSQALHAFEATGTWPEGTVFAREDREGATKGSINKAGVFQSEPVVGVELHVKDKARFKGGWAFFASGGSEPAQYIPTSASCYACHQGHGAVDTTFVQFYPTLIGIAKAKRTLSANYLHDARHTR